MSLPPPRFSVKFCPYSVQLQTDHTQGHRSTINARKVRPGDRHDDREHCPGCNIQIAVAAHSGLPSYRRLLFASHISAPPTTSNGENRASFACSSCYKTFDESYAFLDHVFQKEIGSERSCLRRWSGITAAPSRSSSASSKTDYAVGPADSDPALVEVCLKNCLQRELTRSRAMKKSIELLREAAALPPPPRKDGVGTGGRQPQQQNHHHRSVHDIQQQTFRLDTSIARKAARLYRSSAPSLPC